MSKADEKAYPNLHEKHCTAPQPCAKRSAVLKTQPKVVRSDRDSRLE